jgi:hypothetical protein
MIAGMTNIDPHGAATVLGLANSTIAAAKTLVDLAKSSANHELKNQVSDVLSNVLEMKIKILELDEENRSLREKLKQKGNMRRESSTGFYFKEGETDPLCPKCYEGTDKLIYLPASEPWSRGVRRTCRECRSHLWERQPSR